MVSARQTLATPTTSSIASKPSKNSTAATARSRASMEPLRINTISTIRQSSSAPCTTSTAAKNGDSGKHEHDMPKATRSKATRTPVSNMNSYIVSSLSVRGGARPMTASKMSLPPNYNSVARKVTLAIVALPIVIVTSYVLWDRLVLGRDRKQLVVPNQPAGMTSADRGSRTDEVHDVGQRK